MAARAAPTTSAGERPDKAAAAPASAGNPRPIPVDRESTTETAVPNARAALSAAPNVPDRAADRCTETTPAAPDDSRRWYAEANASGDGREVVTACRAVSARATSP